MRVYNCGQNVTITFLFRSNGLTTLSTYRRNTIIVNREIENIATIMNSVNQYKYFSNITNTIQKLQF